MLGRKYSTVAFLEELWETNHMGCERMRVLLLIALLIFC